MKLHRWIFIFEIVLTAACIFFCSCTSSVENADKQSSISLEQETSTGETDPLTSPILLGYYTGDENSYTALQDAAPYLNIVSADIYVVQPDGSVNGMDERGVLDWNAAHSIETYACVNNYNSDPTVNDFDAELAHTTLTINREKVIEELVKLAKAGGYAGINIDFENLAYSADIEDDRAAFTIFIQELTESLHANDLKLIISVPGKTNDSRDNTWAYPFDMLALGEAADHLQLMTYDQHGPWGEPGAVAGVDWVEACLEYAVSHVAPEKLLIGLPAYGYDWDLTASNISQNMYTAGDVSWKDFPALLEKDDTEMTWDPVSQSPYLTYSVEGHAHVVWFENEESIRVKTALVKKYDLAGISMWALGKEDASFWQVIWIELE